MLLKSDLADALSAAAISRSKQAVARKAIAVWRTVFREMTRRMKSLSSTPSPEGPRRRTPLDRLCIGRHQLNSDEVQQVCNLRLIAMTAAVRTL